MITDDLPPPPPPRHGVAPWSVLLENGTLMTYFLLNESLALEILKLYSSKETKTDEENALYNAVLLNLAQLARLTAASCLSPRLKETSLPA